MYPNPSAFERACEEYLLAGEGETDTEERMLLKKKERVELARTCRQSENALFRTRHRGDRDANCFDSRMRARGYHV